MQDIRKRSTQQHLQPRPNHGFSQGLLEWDECEDELTGTKSGYVGISASEQEQIVAHL